MNCLPADDSHEISSLIFIRIERDFTKSVICYSCDRCIMGKRRSQILGLFWKEASHIIQERHKTDFQSTGPGNKKNWHKIENIFLCINFNIYFGCSKEPSH